MEYQTLLFEIKDGIALITINRPDKLNALNDQVMAELADVAQRLATDDAIRGAILTGAGPRPSWPGPASGVSPSKARSAGKPPPRAAKPGFGGPERGANPGF